MARLGEKRLLRARNRPPSLPNRESNDGSQPLPPLGESMAPRPLAPTLGLPDLRPLNQDRTQSPQRPPSGAGTPLPSLSSEDKCRTPAPPVAPGSGCSHVQSLNACRNRLHCCGHKGCPLALCPVYHTDILWRRRPISTLGSWGSARVQLGPE